MAIQDHSRLSHTYQACMSIEKLLLEQVERCRREAKQIRCYVPIYGKNLIVCVKHVRYFEFTTFHFLPAQ